MATGVRREWYWEGGEHEVTYALHLGTLQLNRFRGCREDADAWKASHNVDIRWLTGTLDWRGKFRGARWLDDFKGGKWSVNPLTKQISSYLLFDYIEAGRPRDYVAYRSITQWPKYPINEPPKRTWGPLVHALELEEHLDDLRWAVDHPDEVNPEPISTLPFDQTRPLSRCAFCPCRPEFPVAAWMHNYKYRAGASCWPGMIKLTTGEQ